MSRLPVLPRTELAAGEVRRVWLHSGPDGRPRQAIVLRDHGGVLRAYLNECRHVPIPLDAGMGAFLTSDGAYLLCSTHGARYQLDDGYCVHGPCRGTSLRSIPLEDHGGELCVVDDEAP